MQSYAPFQALPSDTRDSVEQRIVEYYSNRLFQLTQPSQRGSHWANRSNAKPVTPTVVAAAVEPTE